MDALIFIGLQTSGKSTGRGEAVNTKDAKSTKMEFDDRSNCVIGCANEVLGHR